jgi:hypothetical protein
VTSKRIDELQEKTGRRSGNVNQAGKARRASREHDEH